MNNIILSCLIILCSFPALAQKKVLSLEDFNGWNSISRQSITDNGAYVMWTKRPQEGDATLFVHHVESGETVEFPRASNASFDKTTSKLVFELKPEYEKVRELKRKKTKKKDMPKNGLVIYDFKTASSDTITDINGYSMPNEEGNWLAITMDAKPTMPIDTLDTVEVGGSKEEEETEKKEEEKKEKPKKKKKKKFDGKFVRLINLETDTVIDIENVNSKYWPDYASNFYFFREDGDSVNHKGLFSLSLEDLSTTLIDSTFKDCKNISLNKRGSILTYMTTMDSAKADLRYYSVKMWDGKKSTVMLDTASTGMTEGWMPSPDFKVVIDENAEYLLVGTKPIPTIYPKDTMALEEEKVSLDIWSWHDDIIQPMQNKNKNRDAKKAYLGRISLSDGSFIQLGDDEFEISSYPRDTVSTYLAAANDKKYRHEASWLVPTHQNVGIVEVATGKRIMVQDYVRTRLSFSPNQKYAYWYNRAERNWFAFEISTQKVINLSEHMKYPIWDETWDAPDDPRQYARIGWVDDSLFVFSDKYDFWAVDPQKPKKLHCLTKGEGRKKLIEYNFVYLKRSRKTISQDKWLLSTYNVQTKDEGYVELDWKKGEFKVLVEPSNHSYGYILKAKDAEQIIYTKGNFVEYPELYLNTVSMSATKKLSDTNPQQKDFNWGTVELVEWKAGNGKKMKGLLYKPENFDPNKKYPMLVYFYETYTDNLHRYYAPKPSASVISFPYFVSNEYLIFVPDIIYKTGQPGEDAMDCIVSGAKKLAKESWVDEENMAIQGQSWGGYQVAYLVTKTNLFKCAMAGAPVSNMTSAYGGIRWGTGMSREFQYERTQSRIGATLWEDRDAYIKNSPVFFADKVETPLLMMHNDKDGAVPWYQGIEYFMALRRLGKPAWLLVYNGEDHNLRKRHNRKDLSIRMAQFFDHYLKDAPAPEWMVEGRKALEKDENPALKLMEE